MDLVEYHNNDGDDDYDGNDLRKGVGLASDWENGQGTGADVSNMNMNVMYEGISYSRVSGTGTQLWVGWCRRKDETGNKSQNVERSPGGEHLSRTQTLQIRFLSILIVISLFPLILPSDSSLSLSPLTDMLRSVIAVSRCCSFG